MAKAGNSKQPNGAEVAKFEAEHSEKIPSLRPAGVFGLLTNSIKTITLNWKSLGGILLIYLFLYAIFVNNFGNLSSTATNVKTEVNLASSGNEKISHVLIGYSDLVSGRNMTQVNSLMQNILLIITSLAIIWTLRQLIAGKKVDVKSAFYNSTKPLIPFLLVIFVLFLELLPMTLGTVILASVMINFFAKSAFIIALFSILIALLVILSIYLVINNILAIYIVTLPDMQPVQSLKLAKKMVRGHRWKVFANLLLLVLLLLIISIVVVVSMIFIWAPIVPYTILLLGAIALLFAHTYLFNFYRTLI